MSHVNKRLLLLSCSERKNASSEPLPAILRYDGPVFRLVRKYLRENPEQSRALDINILSAEYGLISANFPIIAYDRRMDQERANDLRPETLRKITDTVKLGKHKELFVSLGKDYLVALSGLVNLLSIKIIFAQGSYGGRLAALQNWLYQGQLPETVLKNTSLAESTKIKFRGVEINMSQKDILKLAKDRITSTRGAFDTYLAWYVQIENKRVSPKWLVSQLTGLPVNSFHSIEARRVLQRLGIKINHL